MTVIDGVTNAVITTVAVGHNPNALCWNSMSNKIYSANNGSGNVTIIDGVTNAVITTVAVGDDPCALFWNSTNNKVYCANGGSGDVTIIDGVTNNVLSTLDVGSWPIAFSRNSAQNRTYVANYGSSSISVIRDATGIQEDKIPIVESNCLRATVFRGPLQLPEGNKCKIFDITGRVVEPNKMKPGIYFIEVDGVVTQKVVKIR